MTLERWTDGTGTELVRLIECPFCGESIGPRNGRHRGRHTGAVSHLRGCESFFETMGVDPDDPLDNTEDAARADSDPVAST